MKTELMNKMSRSFHKLGLNVKKHSPEILLVAGIAGGVTSAVIACKATTKAGAILDDMHDQMDKIHQVAQMEDIDYTEQDLKKDTTIVYTQTAVKFAKLYGPAIVLGAASIASILAGHKIISKRNAALTAAYAAVDKGFKEYRSRVVDRFGEGLDKELRYGVKAEEIEKEVVDPETGEVTTEKETVNNATAQYSDFARCFDDGCVGWSKDANLNLMFVRRMQDWANDKLKTQGHLFLNEVYDMFGFDRIPAGQEIGWLYDPKRNDLANFVDFNVYDINKEANRLFVNGKERNVWLDFNVDGAVFDLMSKKRKSDK